MGGIFKNLMDSASRGDQMAMNHALLDLGLLAERHTQNRYDQKEYYHLMGGNDDLYNYRMSNAEVMELIHFLFYHIISIQIHQVTVVWCLGKCYGFDFKVGMKKLMAIFKDDHEVFEQLQFSWNALFSESEYGEGLTD